MRWASRPSAFKAPLGSGVIVSPDGVVVTNTHVIKGRGETEIRIALSDKREFDAKVLTQDDKTDIAILKIENGDTRFPTIGLERSRHAQSGRHGARDRQSVRRWTDSDEVASSPALARTEVGSSKRRYSSRPTRLSIPATRAARSST